MKEMSIVDFRKDMGKVLKELPVTLTSKGKPVADVLPHGKMVLNVTKPTQAVQDLSREVIELKELLDGKGIPIPGFDPFKAKNERMDKIIRDQYKEIERLNKMVGELSKVEPSDEIKKLQKELDLYKPKGGGMAEEGYFQRPVAPSPHYEKNKIFNGAQFKDKQMKVIAKI